jgi:predicted ester cyclase
VSAEENKAVVRRFWDEVWNKRNQDLAEALVTEKVMPQVRRSYGLFVTACPDLTVTVEDILAEGDRVADHVIFRGTHTGPLNLPGMSIPPTGKTVSTRMVEIWQVQDGRMCDHWGEWDKTGLMQQLGGPSPLGVG